MTENVAVSSENNSELEKTEEETCIVEPLATPYRMIFSLDKDELEKEIVNFWKESGELIVEKTKYKGKKQKGGKTDLKKARQAIEKSYGYTALYGNIFTKFSADKIKEKYEAEKKRCMYIQDFSLDLRDENNPTLLCIFYFWSEMYFTGTLNYDIDQPAHWDEEKEFERRCKQLQQIHKISTETESDSINEDQEVLIDLITSCEGKACDEKGFRGRTLKVGSIIIPELKEALLQHKSGDLFELSYVSTQKDAFENKTIDAHVKIFKVLDITHMDMDDDALYQKEGFEDKASFKEIFSKQYNEYVMNAKRSLAFDHIVNQLIMEGEFNDIPQGWVAMRSKFFADQHIQSCGGNLEKARKTLGLAEDAPINKAFEGRVFQEALNQMAVHLYCDMWNLEADANAMAAHILSKVNWVLPK